MGLTKRGAAAASAAAATRASSTHTDDTIPAIATAPAAPAPDVSRRSARAGASAPAAAAAAATAAADPLSSADTEVPYTYRHHSPVVLLGSFAVALCLVLYCGVSLYLIRRAASASALLDARVAGVQELRARQLELNAHTQHKWDLYAEQRGNVTQHLLHALRLVQEEDGATAPSLCILGAGNLNDVHLQSLLRPVENETLLPAQTAMVPADGGTAGPPASPSATTTTDTAAGDAAAAASQPRPLGFSSLSLVDLDSASMESGLSRQVSLRGLDSGRRSRVRMYASDVTGSFERLSQWKKERLRFDAAREAGQTAPGDVFPPMAALDAWIATLQQRPVAGDGSALVRPRGLPTLDSNGARVQYDVVASVCLLSQLLDMYMQVVPESHPRFLAGALALRESHLALLLDLARPGAWLLLVTDVVASTTLPALRHTAHADLPALLPDMIASSNFFSGCNPRAIHAKLASHFRDSIRPGTLRTLHPWKWRIGGDNDKQFLVYAMLFQKAG